MTDTNELIARLRKFVKPDAEVQPFQYMQAMADVIDKLTEQQMGIDALRRVHRESDNIAHPKDDGWPPGHCNRDGEAWPCSTIRLLGIGEHE